MKQNRIISQGVPVTLTDLSPVGYDRLVEKRNISNYFVINNTNSILLSNKIIIQQIIFEKEAVSLPLCLLADWRTLLFF